MKEMDHIKTGSIDMILCDLPYGILNRRNPSAKWDIQLPLDKLWLQYKRITKKHSAIILFASGFFTAVLMNSNPKMWRYNLVWDKVLPSGFLNANKMPLRAHEDICVFYQQHPLYHPQMVQSEPHRRNHSKGNMSNPQKNSCYGNFVETPTIICDQKYPKSIISIPKEHKVGSFYHPTQKPVDLLRWLIRTYTNPGDIVLDNCMGSGSTGVACLLEERKFIGIEIEKKYFEIAKERMSKTDKENEITV